MFFELDGSFPNHPASPLEPQNLVPLRERVLQEKADLGAAFVDELYWREPSVKGAQNIPVFLDCLATTGWPDQTSVPPAYDGQPLQDFTLAEQIKNFCIDRHNGFVNGLFMDWSVRKVGLKELWTLKWHRKFDVNGPWTKDHVPLPVWPDWMEKFKDY
jgi:prepilin-type processing-associated H-X9-DG protein